MEEFNLKLEVLEVYTGFDRNMMVGVFKLTVMLLDSHSHHWSHHDVFLIWVFDDDLFSDRLIPVKAWSGFTCSRIAHQCQKGRLTAHGCLSKDSAYCLILVTYDIGTGIWYDMIWDFEGVPNPQEILASTCNFRASKTLRRRLRGLQPLTPSAFLDFLISSCFLVLALPLDFLFWLLALCFLALVSCPSFLRPFLALAFWLVSACCSLPACSCFLPFFPSPLSCPCLWLVSACCSLPSCSCFLPFFPSPLSCPCLLTCLGLLLFAFLLWFLALLGLLFRLSARCLTAGLLLLPFSPTLCQHLLLAVSSLTRSPLLLAGAGGYSFI